MAGIDNLKPIKDTETARALGAKGGKASGEARRRKANLRKAANEILANSKTKVKVDGVIKEMTAEEAVVIAMLNKALKGDVGAYKALMATIGLGGKSELDEQEQKLRVKRMKLQQELYEAAKKRAEGAGETDAFDDGFLAALGATAANDWTQE